MAVRMVSAIARTIPTVAGFSAMCPLLVPGCRIFIGNNRRRCVSYFTLRWLSKKCNFEPRACVSSVDEGQRPSHRPRCDRQYDRGCEHQTQQTESKLILAHVGALSTKSNVEAGKLRSSASSAQPNG